MKSLCVPAPTPCIPRISRESFCPRMDSTTAITSSARFLVEQVSGFVEVAHEVLTEQDASDYRARAGRALHIAQSAAVTDPQGTGRIQPIGDLRPRRLPPTHTVPVLYA